MTPQMTVVADLTRSEDLPSLKPGHAEGAESPVHMMFFFNLAIAWASGGGGGETTCFDAIFGNVRYPPEFADRQWRAKTITKLTTCISNIFFFWPFCTPPPPSRTLARGHDSYLRMGGPATGGAMIPPAWLGGGGDDMLMGATRNIINFSQKLLWSAFSRLGTCLKHRFDVWFVPLASLWE